MIPSSPARTIKNLLAQLFSRFTDRPIITERNLMMGCELPMKEELYEEEKRQSFITTKDLEVYSTVAGVRFYFVSRRSRGGTARVKLIDVSDGRSVHMDEEVFKKICTKEVTA